MAFRIRLGDRGRMVLPSVIRRRMGLRTGDVLILDQLAEGEMRLRVARHAVAELQGSYAVGSDEASLVDELERERRAEALREDADASTGTSDQSPIQTAERGAEQEARP